MINYWLQTAVNGRGQINKDKFVYIKSCKVDIQNRCYPIISGMNYDLIVGYRTGKPGNRWMNRRSAFRYTHTPTNITQVINEPLPSVAHRQSPLFRQAT